MDTQNNRETYKVKTSNRRVDVIEGATVWVNAADARAFAQFREDSEEDVQVAIAVLNGIGKNILNFIPKTDNQELVAKFQDKFQDNRDLPGDA